MLLYIDHYDSFSCILVDYIRRLGCQVKMVKTDQLNGGINYHNYSHVVIGPGPGHPNELIHLYPVIEKCIMSKTPILGVCLGHQLLAQFFGGVVIKSQAIMHGQCSRVFLRRNSVIFRHVLSPFYVTRYHSLMVENATLPSNLLPLAYTKDKELMAFQHQNYQLWGLQYHPEAYLTEHGLVVFKNFLAIK